jgi:SAM-dependent methyltransferase
MEDAREYYAQTYDEWVPDWPGELDFYAGLARVAQPAPTLELAAGTGRIAIRLADAGVDVTALDSSPPMLEIGRRKSAGRDNPSWVEGDMRTFDLRRRFGLVLIPAHSFQNLLTASDQRACLEGVRRHLVPSGHLVLHLDHQDIDWLGDLYTELGGGYEAGPTFRHPANAREVRQSQAWWYERATQTAIVRTRWEELDDAGQVVATRESEPTRIHCAFPFEIEHALAACGFEVERVMGDFSGAPLTDESAEMIWIARVP